jgi:PAS domain S-box-containing protein
MSQIIPPTRLGRAYLGLDSLPSWEDGERVFRRGWQLGDDGERRVVLFVQPLIDHASRASLDRLTHEYGLREQLDRAWAVRPLDLVDHAGRQVLVLEDSGGEPLEKLLDAPLELERFCDLAIAIAAAIGRLHAQGLVHKDIRPANILVHQATGEVRLTGFGIASRLVRERQSPRAPETIAGTLAYMAPEQTGRMNRSIDSRSDLYALGISLYQMLVGALPFNATDLLGWVHCHLAQWPAAPVERRQDVPAAISAIIMKLLAKMAEDRYQTATGVESDLRRCLADLKAQHRVDNFPLGMHDVPGRLMLPEKLYGRRREAHSLLAAFDRVARNGTPELILVSGPSGIGKSSVVSELNKTLLSSQGLFASGKFDQNKHDIPYAAFAQAFQQLVEMVLAEPTAVAASYRDAIAAAVGPYGQFMVNLAPNLERIIGPQASIAELPSQDARRVFEQVLQRFVCVFARPEHPLTLFLDDLQWIDAATLDVLEYLLRREEVKHLLVVGAFRDNEVSPDHPVRRIQNQVRKAGVPVEEICLATLTLSDMSALVAEALHDDDILPLAQLVHNKTAGNPLFATQFLTSLVDDGLVAFDPDTQRWTWDEPRITARNFTDNVAELMIGRITRLPALSREAMQIVACIGNTVQADLLAAALDKSRPDLHDIFRPAIEAGLVTLQGGSYRLLHDRIQEMSYALIPEAERAHAHLRVGRRLLDRTPTERLDENIFEIVNQLNRGVALVSDRRELDQIAEFNAKAGRRAKASAAYAMALSLLHTGARLFGEAGWERNRSLAFTLAFERAECEFLMGDLAAADAHLTDLVARADRPNERAAVACLRIMLHVTRSEPTRSVEVCLEYLEREGIAFSRHPSREDVEAELEQMWQALGSRSIDDLARLPKLDDVATLATLDVLAAAASPAWFSDQLLPAMIGARIANISINNGNGPASSFGYAMLGMKLGPFSGDYRTAYRFGKVALELAEQTDNPRTLGRVLFGYTMFTRPWADNLDGCRALLERGFEAAERGGDVTYATYLLCNIEELLLFSGSQLEDTEAACRRAFAYALNLNFDFAVLAVRSQLALTRMLQGNTETFGSLDGPEFDQSAFERRCSGVPALALPMCWYWVRRQQAQLLAGDFQGSMAAAEAAEPLLWFADVYLQSAEHHFYGALARIGCLATADTSTRRHLREQIQGHLAKLAIFAKNSPATFGSRAALVAAEFDRVEGREREAMSHYEAAIQSARAAGFCHLEALSLEMAARFYDARNLETIASNYRREAHAAYQRWGAFGKVQHLEREFPELRNKALLPGTSIISAPVEQLDLGTVIAVSQLFSGEIEPVKLVESFMRVVVQHAGAAHGYLVKPEGTTLRIEAEATARDEAIDVRVYQRDGHILGDLPEQLVRYVVHTRETAIVDDAMSPGRFSDDPYIAKRRARAILCLPLVNQGQLIGILYLENNLTPHVFTPGHVAVLNVLASQAAISLENSRLYHELAKSERDLRSTIDGIPGLVVMLAAGGEIEVVNRQVLEYFGQTLDELKDWSTSGAVHEEDLPHVRDHFTTSIASGSPYRLEQRLRRFDGDYRWFDNRGVPIRDDLGRVVRWYVLLTDIEERTQALAGLQQVQLDLARMNRVSMMGELAASLSHEITQPIASARNNARAALNFLQRSPPDLSEVKEALDCVVGDSDRAGQIVDRIRDQIKKAPPRKDEFDLASAIRDVITLARNTIMRNGVSVQTLFDDGIDRVHADRIQLQQVVLNLVLNAVEAMGSAEGAGAIEERSRALSIIVKQDHAGVLITVRDSGPGIDPAHLERVFDPFYTTKPGGTGMGLSICRSIIDAHGGRMWAEPSNSRGAVFRFSLPGIRTEVGS